MLNYVTLTGTYTDGTGDLMTGSLLFIPSAPLADAVAQVQVRVQPIRVQLVNGQIVTNGTPGVELLATDNSGLAPAGWGWTVTESLGDLPSAQWSFFLPYANGATQDISTLAPATDVVPLVAYLDTAGGTMTGPLTLTGQFAIPAGAAAGDVWTAQDDDGTGGWTAPQGGSPSGSAGGDLSGTFPDPEVTGLHLASPVPIGQGGTGASTGSAALANLGAAAAAALAAETSRAEGAEGTLATAISAETTRAEAAEAALMPLPGGTATSGRVPVATGTGAAAIWATLTAAGIGADLAGAAAAAQAAAQTFATGAVGTETSRAQAAEALLAALAGAAFTGPVSVTESAPAGGIVTVVNSHATPSSPSVQYTAQSAADLVVGVSVTGDTVPRLEIDSNGQLLWGPGGSTATDTNLQRGGVGLLTTTARFQVQRNNAGGGMFIVANTATPTAPSSQFTSHAAADLAAGWNVAGDGQYRLIIDSNGKMLWGPGGTTAGDTDLYRTSAGVLATDGSLNVGGALKVGGTALGTAAFQPTSAFDTSGAAAAAQAASLQKSSNLSDLGSAATARTNLGLGTAATQPTSAFDASGAAAAALAAAEAASLAVTNNLSDLASPSAARTNLGLGTVATLNTPLPAADVTGVLTGLTAADTSLVVAGSAAAPTVRTATLDVIASLHPAAAAWSNNGQKITGIANGSAAGDVAAFGQIPVVAASTAYHPANPTGTTSTSLVMCGLGAAFEPLGSGKVLVTATFYVQTTGSGVNVTAGVRYGTGTAPVNGAAVTGTRFGSNTDPALRCTAAGVPVAYAFTDVLALTAGTTYWFDACQASNNTSNTVTVTSISVALAEQAA